MKAYMFVLANPKYTWDWPEPYIYSVYDHISGDFPAKKTVYTPYIYIYTYMFWLTLNIHGVGQTRIDTPYVTVYLMKFLQIIPCIHRVYMHPYKYRILLGSYINLIYIYIYTGMGHTDF